jgi:polysaccharide deacetylase 2 family uncharacterized protein YibQ
MFAKPNSSRRISRPDSGPSGASAITAKVLANPTLSVSAAGLFFMVTAAAALMITGNPHAGTPSVRIHLAQPGASPPPGWREGLAPDPSGPIPVSVDTLQLFAAPAGDTGPIQGQAVITMAGGGGAIDHTGEALAAAPLAGFTAPGPGGGLLPVVASNGRTPAEAYARPFQSNGKPKIAIVIGGLGLNAKSTREAIEQLPADVTLSFVPYAEGLQGWIDLARANGHEVLLEAPMEPNDYPQNDPGPYTLMAGARPQETIQGLEWLLSRATGYFGVTNYLGSKFVTSDTAMASFTGGLKQRGLAFIDDGSAVRKGGGLPRLSADRVIDDQLADDAIDRQLLALEAAAMQNGQALGAGFAYPVTLTQLTRWTASLAQRGYQLAPASALMVKR